MPESEARHARHQYDRAIVNVYTLWYRSWRKSPVNAGSLERLVVAHQKASFEEAAAQAGGTEVLEEGNDLVSFINYPAREITCRIVYYGAGQGGKTTNLRWICDQAVGKAGGRMISYATEVGRTLYFDFLPLDVGTIKGFKTRFHLYTVPGQVVYDDSRKLILRGVDGVILVADSQEERMDANLEAIDNLVGNLEEQKHDFTNIPYVLQLNKRDLAGALPVETLRKELMRKNEPVCEAIAHQGRGVFEALKCCGRMVLGELKK